MKFQDFIDDPEPLVGTLAQIFQKSGENNIVGLLRGAHAQLLEIGYDEWEGGTTFYSLDLTIPATEFAVVGDRLSQIEKVILNRAQLCLRRFTQEHVNDVRILPQLQALIDWRLADGQIPSDPTEERANKLWKSGFFRLFLSHTSRHKQQIADLKGSLAHYGVDGFVAHKDIEPSLEWQSEIEIALISCQALAAFLTPDLHESNWADQEIGFALGRNKLVLPIKVGMDPYGFISKVQALPGWLEEPKLLAVEIVKILRNDIHVAQYVQEGLVIALENANTFDNSKSIFDVIRVKGGFTNDQYRRLIDAAEENFQVKGASGGRLGSKVKSFVYEHVPSLAPQEKAQVDPADYNPFEED